MSLMLQALTQYCCIVFLTWLVQSQARENPIDDVVGELFFQNNWEIYPLYAELRTYIQQQQQQRIRQYNFYAISCPYLT